MYGGSFLFLHDKLYRSIDGGVNWDTVPSANYGSNAVYFSDAANGILLGNNGRMYATTDSAKSWTFTGFVPTYNLKDIAYVNPQLGYIVGDKGAIMVSKNGGNFVNDNFGIPSTIAFQRLRTYGKYAYAVSSNGVVVSTKPSSGVGQKEDFQTNKKLNLYPNPISESSILEIPISYGKLDYITFTNATGQIIEFRYSEGDKGNIEIYHSQNPMGLYFYKIQFANSEIITGSFMLE